MWKNAEVSVFIHFLGVCFKVIQKSFCKEEKDGEHDEFYCFSEY